MYLFLFSSHSHTFDRFIPVMQGQRKPCPMDRKQQLPPHIQMSLHRLFGHHMNIRPTAVILTTFHERHIKWAVFFTDLLKMRTIPAIPAEKHRLLLLSMTQDDHKVESRSNRLRPEKCLAGVQMSCKPSNPDASHQLCSVILDFEIPQRSK